MPGARRMPSSETVTIVLLLTMGLSCSAQQGTNSLTSLLDTARSGKLTALDEWVGLGGLGSLLQGEGPYTLLAPSNDAFANLPPSVVWKLKADDKFLEAVLKYHIIDGSKTALELLDKKKIKSLQGEDLTFSQVLGVRGAPSSPLQVEQRGTDGSVIHHDVPSSNGLLHLVDKVLMPPSLQEDDNLEQVLRATGNAGTFLDLVKQAGLLDSVREGSPLTVFAPTDDAFRRVDPSIMRQLRREPRLLKAVILSHLVSTDLDSFKIRTSTVTENRLGELIVFRIFGQIVMVNTARIIRMDLLAKNGALHIIDGLLLPSINALGRQGPPPTKNVFSMMRQAGLTIFTQLVQNSGLGVVVQNGTPLTVFAPSDAALSSLPREQIKKLETDLDYRQKFLFRHLVPERIPTSAFGPDVLKDNYASEKTRLNVYRRPGAGTVYTANGVPLSVADELGTNGVLHVLERTLPTAGDNALNVLREDPRFSTFLSGVQASDLIGPLRGNESVTVFAATNQAFAALPQDEFFSILLDLTRLSSMLGNHVVQANVTGQTLFSSGLCWTSFTSVSGRTMRTALGSDGHILISAGDGRVAKVVETDLVASNGVVHVVDGLF